VYDRETSQAMRRFQLDEGLNADGSAGAAELDALGVYSSPSESVLDIGSAGQNVLRLQRMLRRLGHYSGTLTGRYGSLTASAVRDYQKSAGLTVTGIADSTVLKSLGLDGSTEAPYDSGRSYRIDLLSRLAETIAANEPYAAKVSAAAAALNRESDSAGTLTLAAIVRLIASEYTGNSAALSVTASDQSRRAAHDALSGCDPTSGAKYVSDRDTGGDGVKIGGIWFY